MLASHPDRACCHGARNPPRAVLAFFCREQTHLPGYLDRIDEVKASGAEEVAVVCVNDPWFDAPLQARLPDTLASAAAPRTQGDDRVGEGDESGGQGARSIAAAALLALAGACLPVPPRSDAGPLHAVARRSACWRTRAASSRPPSAARRTTPRSWAACARGGTRWHACWLSALSCRPALTRAADRAGQRGEVPQPREARPHGARCCRAARHAHTACAGALTRPARRGQELSVSLVDNALQQLKQLKGKA